MALFPKCSTIMKRKKQWFITGILLIVPLGCFGFVLDFFFLQAWFGASWFKTGSIQKLADAESPDEMEKIVERGVVLVTKDQSWIAIRYSDNHSYGAWCMGIALDSEGGWYQSREHYCATLPALPVIKASKKNGNQPIDESLYRDSMQKAVDYGYAILQSANLEEAKGYLLKMGFKPIAVDRKPKFQGPWKTINP
jgi:hypothetical protein